MPWISAAQLAMLALHAEPLALLANDGTPLAWTGYERLRPNLACCMSADAGSFVIRYAWDLLRVNEELIGALTAGDIQGEISPHATSRACWCWAQNPRPARRLYRGHVVIGARCKIGPIATSAAPRPSATTATSARRSRLKTRF